MADCINASGSDMLLRRHFQVPDANTCVSYQTGALEDWQHLFFICHFSVRVWNYLQIQWPGVGDLSDIIQAARNQLCVTFSTEIILLAC